MAKAKQAPATVASTPAVMMRAPADLKPYDRNPRTISDTAVAAVAKSIRKFGFTNPILLSSDDAIVAGHTRLKAALAEGLAQVPTITLGLTLAQCRAYRVADNKTAEFTGWDYELLRQELAAMRDEDGLDDLTETGFDQSEIDRILNEEGPDDLAALEDQYGEHDESDSWPTIELQVPPDVMERYNSFLGRAGSKGTHDHVKFARILAAVDIDKLGK